MQLMLELDCAESIPQSEDQTTSDLKLSEQHSESAGESTLSVPGVGNKPQQPVVQIASKSQSLRDKKEKSGKKDKKKKHKRSTEDITTIK